jgi:hypothetical protein
VLRATQRDAAGTEVVERVRAAASEFEKVVEIHLGDHATLDLVLDALPDATSDGLELSRKLAFRGNSGICGIQARTRAVCWLLAPNPADGSRLDIGLISGHIGLRRLRSSIQWPIFKVRQWSDTNEPIASGDWQPLESHDADRNGVALLRSFTRGPAPEIQAVQTEEGSDYILMPGPIGNHGACDCFRGETMRSAANRYRNDKDDVGELGANITNPTADLVFDLIVHRDLAFALKPDVLVFGQIFKTGEHGGSRDDPSLLPISPRLIELAGRPPAVATPLVPDYTGLLQQVYDRMNWDPGDFDGVRVQLRYPPLNSTVLMRFDLPDAP